jgi:hypothetical protein
MAQVYIKNADLPAAFGEIAAEMIQRLVEACQIADTLREMQGEAARLGIALPALDVPTLWDITDASSLPCQLAQQAMDSGILTGVEEWLSPTAV